MRQLAYLATVVALVAVQPALADQSRAAARGRALAQSQCAACHAVNETGASPNPKSPTFRDIAGIYEERGTTTCPPSAFTPIKLAIWLPISTD
jgi:cytochrome c